MSNWISVPFVNQVNQNACGAAALEMIYRYFGLDGISQNLIFNKYKKLEPHGSGNYYIEVSDLIDDAKSRGFISDWSRYDFATDKIKILKEIVNQGFPIIVCQQYTKEQSILGHFRVIVGIGNKHIYLHDPCPITGGENLKWSHDKFFDYWQATGDNVTGGVYLLVKSQ